jgi:hypothetical protein
LVATQTNAPSMNLLGKGRRAQTREFFGIALAPFRCPLQMTFEQTLTAIRCMEEAAMLRP